MPKIYSNITYGNSNIGKVYYGNTLVWSKKPKEYTLTINLENSGYLGTWKVTGSITGQHTSGTSVIQEKEKLTTSYTDRSSSYSYGTWYPSSISFSSSNLTALSNSSIRVYNPNDFEVYVYYGTNNSELYSGGYYIQANSYVDIEGLSEGTTYYFRLQVQQTRGYTRRYYTTTINPSSIDSVNSNVTMTITGGTGTSSGTEWGDNLYSSVYSRATKSPWATSVSWSPSGAGAVFATFVPSVSDTYRFDVERISGSTDTGASLWIGQGTTLVTDNDDSSIYGGNQPGFDVYLTAGVTYYFQLTYYGNRSTWNPEVSNLSGTYKLYVKNSAGNSGSLNVATIASSTVLVEFRLNCYGYGECAYKIDNGSVVKSKGNNDYSISIRVPYGSVVHVGGCADYFDDFLEYGSFEATMKTVVYMYTNITVYKAPTVSNTTGYAYIIQGISSYGFDIDNSYSNPDSSKYLGVFKSNNQGQQSTYSIMKLCMCNINVEAYASSYGEANYDYIMLGKQNYSIPTSYTSNNCLYHTRSNPSYPGSTTSSYKISNRYESQSAISTAYIVYTKDGSGDTSPDTGWVLLTKRFNE